VKQERDDHRASKQKADVERLAALIRKLRDDRGLTLRAMADQADLDVAWLSRVENGGYDQPSPLHLRQLASALGTSPIELFLAVGYLSPEDVRPRVVRRKKGG
jgi:transcriptional regulator with XRE-family HTH domain